MSDAARKIKFETAILRVLHTETHRAHNQKWNQRKNRQHEDEGNDRLHRLKKSIRPEQGKGNNAPFKDSDGVGDERKGRSIQRSIPIEVMDRTYFCPCRINAKSTNGKEEVGDPNASEFRTCSSEKKFTNGGRLGFFIGKLPLWKARGQNTRHRVFHIIFRRLKMIGWNDDTRYIRS